MTTNNTPSFLQAEISIDGEPWRKVETFEGQAPTDRVYLLDSEAGTISFGDGKQGSRPPAGSRITATYRTGDGSAGNILSFTSTVSDPRIHTAVSATITTLPGSIRLGIYQGNEQSWRWKLIVWLCDVLKVRLLDSLLNK